MTVKDKSLLLSVLGHVMILTLLSLDLSFSKDPFLVASIPVMIDLSDVEIGYETNLPVDSRTETSQQQLILPQAGKETASDAQIDIQRQTPKESLNNLLDSLTSKKQEPPKPKTYKLDSLLASVEKKNSPTTSTNGTGNSSAGVEMNDKEIKISVSERDAIAVKLRSCWNLDPGVAGVKNMVARIKVQLNQDGSVKTVIIQDSSRMKSDSAFRAVAESARRAVHICDQMGDGSPFRILAKLYSGGYSTWRDLILNFNPYDGAVM